MVWELIDEPCQILEPNVPRCPDDWKDKAECAVRKLVGFQHDRTKRNPEEKRFSEAWNKDMARYVPNLLDPTGSMYPPDASERDVRVAATVIQWLGSPVGQCFLRDLGYERKRGAK